jgi:hypothetical protein
MKNQNQIMSSDTTKDSQIDTTTKINPDLEYSYGYQDGYTEQPHSPDWGEPYRIGYQDGMRDIDDEDPH